MAVPQKKTNPGDAMESLIIEGDLSRLTPEQRVMYYNRVCESIGVNPLTQPFQYLKLQGKLILYATRACADQLRKINGINIEIVSQDISDELLTVHVRAKDSTGRLDEDLGVVPFPDNLRGDVRANTILRAVTKAKRRVTLSISGLGFLDETEADSIPGAEKGPPIGPEIMNKPYELSTGPQTAAPRMAGAVDAAPPEETPPDGGAAQSFEDKARDMAGRGAEPMRKFYLKCTRQEQARINKIRPEINRIVDEAEAAILADKAAEEAARENEEVDDGRPY